MPGGAAGDLVLFEEENVLPAGSREVVGGTAADDAAADDDDAGVGGKIRHLAVHPWHSRMTTRRLSLSGHGTGSAVLINISRLEAG
jgi:hypothetical protein